MTSSLEKFKVSERKCIATGKVLSKSELVRFVLGPNNVIYPDLENNLWIWQWFDDTLFLELYNF